MSNHENVNINLDADGSMQILRIELVSFLGNLDHLLGDRIRDFAEEQRDIDIILDSSHDYYVNLSPWILGLEGRGTPPDIIEIPYNQMQHMYHHGKLEPLYINEPDLQDYLITAPDGAVIGIKAKVNPLIIYYNAAIFDMMGLEKPSGDWDWDMLDQTITTLKSAGHNVYFMLSPYTLEWLTMNRYDGRISDLHKLRFAGYLDSEAAVQAAEWFAWVGTKGEDFTFPGRHPAPMPHVMIDGQVAIAIDYAYGLFSRYNFERLIESNDQINIAPLPGRYDTQNPAKMTGFAVSSNSPNKDAAMRLLRHLIEDSRDYSDDIAMYTLQASEGVQKVEWIDPSRSSIVMQEIKRSVPASFFMADDHTGAFNYNSAYPFLRSIIDGGPARQALAQYAELLDSIFGTFVEYPDAYGECVKKGREGYCVH